MFAILDPRFFPIAYVVVLICVVIYNTYILCNHYSKLNLLKFILQLGLINMGITMYLYFATSSIGGISAEEIVYFWLCTVFAVWAMSLILYKPKI
jgi:hypothetical protein